MDRTVSTPAHRSGSTCRGGAISLLLLRGLPLSCVSPVLPSASWEAPVEVQGVLKGVSLQGAFSQRGVEPHMSPPGSQPPGLAQSSAWTSHLLGRARTPSHGA